MAADRSLSAGVMAAGRASGRASPALSDFSDASVVSLGPSIQAEGDAVETTHLLPPGDRTFVRVFTSRADASATIAGSSWYASVFLLVNAALGAGLLNFPAAYHLSGGLAVAITVQVVLALFVAGSMVCLTYCAETHASATYQDVVYAFCGRHARVLCSVFIALYSFGACITFFIVIGDQWDKFLSFAYGDGFYEKWYMNRKFTIASTSVVFILPICFSRRVDFLKYVSAVGVLAVLYCVALIVVKYFVGVDCASVGPVRTGPETWTNVFAVVPVLCFGYQCHLSMVPIYSCTRARTLRDFSKTIVLSLFLCFLCYTLTGALGYLTFGDKVKADVLLSYSPTPDVLVAVVAMGLKMYTTYPLLLFVGRAALDSVWAEVRGRSLDELSANELARRVMLTLVWFVSTLALALFIPDIGVVISYLGALAAVFIFIFPGLCLLRLLTDNYLDVSCVCKHVALLTATGAFLGVGAFIFGQVITQSILNNIHDS